MAPETERKINLVLESQFQCWLPFARVLLNVVWVTSWSSLFFEGGRVPFLGLSSCEACRCSSSLMEVTDSVQEQELKDLSANSEL